MQMHGMESHYTDINNLEQVKNGINNTKIKYESVFRLLPVCSGISMNSYFGATNIVIMCIPLSFSSGIMFGSVVLIVVCEHLLLYLRVQNHIQLIPI